MNDTRVLPDGRSFEEAVEENLADLRANPHLDLIGADAHNFAGYLDDMVSRCKVVCEALWRHFEELNR